MANESDTYRQLPERVPLEEMVEEVDVSVPPGEPENGDPNRENAVRLGLVGGIG